MCGPVGAAFRGCAPMQLGVKHHRVSVMGSGPYAAYHQEKGAHRYGGWWRMLMYCVQHMKTPELRLAVQALEMWVGGEAHEFRAPVPRVWAREGAASAANGDVTTPMPGRIIKARRPQ